MAKVKVITDACSDIHKKWRDMYDIDCAPLSVIWDGTERPATPDWDNYSAKEFYDALRAGSRIRTNQVAISTFEEMFTRYLDEGYEIVYVGCSQALSGSVTTGAAVAKSLADKRGEAKIYCVNPRISCKGEAMVAIEAAKLAKEGVLSGEEIAARAEEISRHTHQLCLVDNLTYLKNAGRITASKAFFGNLFGVKPIICNDVNGGNSAVTKAKGKRKGLDMLIDMVKEVVFSDEQIIPASEQTIFVAHADVLDEAEYLAERIKAEIKPKDVDIDYIGPIIGASVGPGSTAVYCFGNTVTFGAK